MSISHIQWHEAKDSYSYMIQGGGFTLSCAIGVEGFKFSLWASASFRLRLEELINKRHFAGS